MNTKNLLFALLVLTIGLQSCKKEKIRGCMDPASLNYNPNAEESDGSCTYAPLTVTEQLTAKWILSSLQTTEYVNGVAQPPSIDVFSIAYLQLNANNTYLMHQEDGTNDSGQWQLVDDTNVLIGTFTYGISLLSANELKLVLLQTHDQGGNHYITESITTFVK